jgi:spore coat polysaccharide biosynthesis protein SpsF
MILAIIQARMGSSRLPGKMMKYIGDKTVIQHCIDQVKEAAKVDHVVVATTTDAEDDALAELAGQLQCDVARGSAEDVLDRFYSAAKQRNAATVVRICGDCPFIDPCVIDETLQFYLDHRGEFDYVSNVHPPSAPDGFDVEVVTFGALERAWKTADRKSQREHVTTAIWEHPELYRVGSFRHREDLSHLRIVVDEQEDLEMLRAIHKKLQGKAVNLVNVMDVIRRHPGLLDLNSRFEREAGYRKSLAEDRKI